MHALRDSNSRPADLESAALPTELKTHILKTINVNSGFRQDQKDTFHNPPNIKLVSW